MPPAINLRTVTNGVGWSVRSKTTTFGLKFVTVPILARILSPEEFGAAAVAQTVVIFLTMVGSAGLVASLMLKHDEEMETVHSVWQVRICGLAGCMLYAVLLLLTGRDLLSKLLQLLRKRRAPAANAGAGG